MIGEETTCAMEGCEVKFQKRSHNQLFCSKEHQRIVTNQAIRQKYYDKKAQRQGLERICEKCNVTRLSRYNDSRICRSCEIESREERDAEALSAIIKATA